MRGDITMITKEMIINDVLADMRADLDNTVFDKLKTVLIVKMHNFQVVEMETALSTQMDDNDFLLKRFAIDMTARNLAKSTIQQYVRTAKNFLNDINKNYRNVTGQDITDYISIYQYQHNTSNTHKRNMMMYLNSFFKWAYKKKHIKEDIMLDVDQVKADAKKKEYLTALEIDDLKDAAKKHKGKRDIALVEFLLSTGMRVGELVRLDISNVNFDTNEVEIYAEKTRQYRTGYLTPRAKKALKTYLNSRTDNNQALFVTTRKPNERLQKSGVELILKNIAREAGVTKHCTVHLFRKTFATTLFANGCDITTIAKLLGHSSTETTIKHYLTIDKEDIKYRFIKAAA
jgi:site-specific recombinase XerD